MSLPSLTKTWQFSANNQTTAQGTALADNRKTLRGLKNALKGFATNAWAVRYSCSSAVAGTAGDGVDRWAADTDLVWAAAGSAHSWVVLRQTGIATNYEICISCEGAASGGTVLTLVVSPSAGFAGGSTTARPTATDESVRLSGTSWGGSGSDVSLRWSAMQSTDGKATYVIFATGGAMTGFWAFVAPDNATTGWSNPSASFALGGANATISALCSNTSALGSMRSGSTTGNLTMTAEGTSSSVFVADTTFGNLANEISSEWPLAPVALACSTTGLRGRHGTMPDLWLGSSARASGDTYPTGTPQFAQFGCLVFPWDGSTPALT